MVKFPEAEVRKFRNVYICKKCKVKIRTTSTKVSQEKAKCRKCKGTILRSVRKK